MKKKELSDARAETFPKGAEASAGVYSLIETAKVNGLNPTKYIHRILRDIPGLPYRESPEYLDDFVYTGFLTVRELT